MSHARHIAWLMCRSCLGCGNYCAVWIWLADGVLIAEHLERHCGATFAVELDDAMNAALSVLA